MAEEAEQRQRGQQVVALDDISATEWRHLNPSPSAPSPPVALDDISATEWRLSITEAEELSLRCTR